MKAKDTKPKPKEKFHFHVFDIIKGSGESGTPKWKCQCGLIIESN